MSEKVEPKVFAADGLIQLHWQDIKDPSKTELVAQGGDFATADETNEWIREVIDRRKSECPDGWIPMVCDSTSEYFVWAAADQKQVQVPTAGKTS